MIDKHAFNFVSFVLISLLLFQLFLKVFSKQQNWNQFSSRHELACNCRSKYFKTTDANRVHDEIGKKGSKINVNSPECKFFDSFLFLSIISHPLVCNCRKVTQNCLKMLLRNVTELNSLEFFYHRRKKKIFSVFFVPFIISFH